MPACHGRTNEKDILTLGWLVKVVGILFPLVIMVIAVLFIQSFPRPLRNSYPSSRPITVEQEQTVRNRLSGVVVTEILVLALIVRSWIFPWRIRRFLAAEIALFFWTGLMGIIATHNGALLSIHALALMFVLMLLIPFVLFGLTARKIFLNIRSVWTC